MNNTICAHDIRDNNNHSRSKTCTNACPPLLTSLILMDKYSLFLF